MNSMKKLDTSKIKSLKDVRSVFDLLDLSFKLPEDHKNYEILKELTVEPEPRKSIEELQQETNKKFDELIEKTKRNYYASNLTAENNYNRQFDRIFNKFEDLKKYGPTPKYGIDCSGVFDLSPQHDFQFIPSGNPSKNWKCYLFGSKPGCYNMVYHPQENHVPNALVRWCSNVFLGCMWVKEK